MLRRAVVFYVIALLFEAFRCVSTLQLQDINRLIENLQHNGGKDNEARDDQSQEMDEHKDYVAAKTRELDALINEAAADVHNQKRNKNNKLYLTKLKSKNLNKIYEQDKDTQQLPLEKVDRNIKDVLVNLEKINSHNNDKHKSKSKEINSKIYLILNPKANLKEKDIKDISNLLSQVQSGSTGKKMYANRDTMNKHSSYKGSVALNGRLARRRNRESKELFSPRDSLEDFKPKRARGDFGSGGRTPIPYIGHRDIYERD